MNILGWLFAVVLPAIIGMSWSAGVYAGSPVTYNAVIRDVMARRCFACHGPDAPTLAEFMRNQARFKALQKGPRMDSYEHLMVFVNGRDAGALMRRLDDGRNTPNGKPGNMHAHLGDSDRERAERLALFRRWVGHWTLKRRAALTGDELKMIQAQRE